MQDFGNSIVNAQVLPQSCTTVKSLIQDAHLKDSRTILRLSPAESLEARC